MSWEFDCLEREFERKRVEDNYCIGCYYKNKHSDTAKMSQEIEKLSNLQNPKTVENVIKTYNSVSDRTYYCGKCPICDEYIELNNYCPKCGQKLEWKYK